MFIVMHCAGIPFNGNTIKEKSLGGSESAAYYIAKTLKEKGHSVTLFTNCTEPVKVDGVSYVPLGKPTEAHPLGDMFHFYAENTPHDVLIIQRSQQAFKFKWASKVNLWWLHDLGHVRDTPSAMENLHQVDGVLVVSQFHKDQVCEAWGLNDGARDVVHVVSNGVDVNLYNNRLREDISPELLASGYTLHKNNDCFDMVYSSRPERGLENLVKPGGIMEKIAGDPVLGENVRLFVCHYDNTTPQMKPYYDKIWSRCNDLPNVFMLGSLNKADLANLQLRSQLCIYPTTFDEVSCITAMEALTARTYLLSSRYAAIPETCSRATKDRYTLIDTVDGQVDCDAFYREVKKLYKSDLQLESCHVYDWSNAADMFLDVIEGVFNAGKENPAACILEMLKNSDIVELKYYIEKNKQNRSWLSNPLIQNALKEVEECYGFMEEASFKDHYEAYYEYEENRGVVYGPENLDGNDRFECVSRIIGENLKKGQTVLDYGCAHGHYTINLAKRYPGINFIGVDISQSNIDKAITWSSREELSNVKFYCGEADIKNTCLTFADLENEGVQIDAFIVAEVLEHVNHPDKLVDALAETTDKNKPLFIVTTPYGPWESQGYKEHYPWRAHIYHFEREHIRHMFNGHSELAISAVPSGTNKQGDIVGSFVYTFNHTGTKSNAFPLYKTLRNPRQTVSACFIVKDGEKSLFKALASVQDNVDEIIVGVDATTTDGTKQVIQRFKAGNRWPLVTVFNIDSPMTQGFDSARNETISKASGDWILWFDSDEYVINSHEICRYMRPSIYNGYMLAQHHFATQPLGVLTTDYPVRLFRNNRGIKFIGCVHEHPEKKINEGVGYAMVLPNVCIPHDGYVTEEIRRKRFLRNIDLMVKDKETHPDRLLGKFLWIRDFCQMCSFEMETNGSRLTPKMVDMANQSIVLFEELLESGNIKMILDSIKFVGSLVGLLGGGIRYKTIIECGYGTLKEGHMETPIEIDGLFAKKEHIYKINELVMNMRLDQYEKKYF